MQGLKLQTKATTPAAGDYVGISKRVAVGCQPFLAYRFYFRSPASSPIHQIEMYLGHYTGSVVRRYDVYYHPASKLWKYYTPATGWVAFPGGSQDLDLNSWSVLEIQVSLVSAVIKSFKCNNLVLSDLNLNAYSIADSSSPHFDLNLYARTLLAGVGKLFLGNVLVTGVA